jgi:hypothetical protein
MALQPFNGFKSLETHHCITGSMLHIYDFYNHPVSEDMLLGLGAGLGFMYWHQKGAPPMYGGRANFARPGSDDEGLEFAAGRRTGVTVERFHTGSASKAEKTLVELLEAGKPVMLMVDMGFLPYFEFPDDYHFGGHAIAVGGYDPDSRTVLVTDRDTDLYPMTLEELAQARGSTFKPFPPQNQWFTFDFSQTRMPTPDDVRQAICETAVNMLEGPISNFGVRGIRRAHKETLKWPAKMDQEELRWACFNNFIFIDATGGTGGGIFRYMYARFLKEAADITGDQRLANCGDALRAVGDRWQEVAEGFKAAYEAPDPADRLPEIVAPLPEIADREEAIWTELREMVEG